MATAQKRGFRFPWGGDSHREESEPSDAATMAAQLELPDDLGRGPFDLQQNPPGPTAEPEPTGTARSHAAAARAEASPAEPDTAPAIAGTPASSPRLVVRTPNAERMVIPAEAPVAAAVSAAAPVTDRAPETEAASKTDAPPKTDAAPETDPVPVTDAPPVTDAAASDPDPVAAAPVSPATWPDVDRRSSRPAAPSPKAAPNAAAAEARRANPLVAGLVKAMREAARTAHDDAVATLKLDVAARTEAIREYGTARAAELKKAADVDVLAIREWSKAEMARVREETESKIAARKIQLVAETERELRETDGLLAKLTTTIEAFEAETEAFFKVLLAEEDPGRLAGLAEQLPPPPSLDGFPGDDNVSAGGSRAQSGQSLPPTPAPAPSETPSGPDPQAVSADDVIALAEPGAEATGPTRVAADEVTPTVDEPPADGLDADAAAAAEAEALAGLDHQTQVIVSGLTSVGAISTFKSALLAGPGVSAVGVNAGTEGDVLFTVTHAGDTDLRQVVGDIEAFQPRVIADDGSSLVVVAREPAA